MASTRRKRDLWRAEATRMALAGDTEGLIQLGRQITDKDRSPFEELLQELCRIEQEGVNNAGLRLHISRWLADPESYKFPQETYIAQELPI